MSEQETREIIGRLLRKADKDRNFAVLLAHGYLTPHDFTDETMSADTSQFFDRLLTVASIKKPSSLSGLAVIIDEELKNFYSPQSK